jgi:hypothetical protein
MLELVIFAGIFEGGSGKSGELARSFDGDYVVFQVVNVVSTWALFWDRKNTPRN